MIWKKSAMDLDTTAIIKPIKIQEEGIDGRFGPQDRWYAQVDGDDATIYTGYYEEGRPDALGQAFRQAVKTGEVVAVTKGFDKSKNRAAYSVIVGEGKSTAPQPQSSGPGVSEEYKREREKKQREQELAGKVKGYQIAYQGLGKFVGTPGATPEENHARIVAQYELMEEWATAKATAGPVDELYKAIDAAHLGPHTENFVGWLASHYKKSSLDELSNKEIAHSIINLPAAIKTFRGREEAEEDHRRDQAPNGIIGEPEDVCPF